MRLTGVVTDWLISQEWEERPEINDEEATSTTMFTYMVDECFQLTCYFEVDENSGYFKIFSFLFGTRIPEHKLDAVIAWVNQTNITVPIGFMSVKPDKRILRYYASTDVQDAPFDIRHITNLMMATENGLATRLPELLTICFGNDANKAGEESPFQTKKGPDDAPISREILH